MSQDEDDQVGYGRPPRHSRFKPGQSGNPRGRPKGARNLHSQIFTELMSPIAVTIDGQRQRMSPIMVVFKQLAAKGMKGDIKAARLLVDFIEQHSPELLTPASPAHATASDQQIIERYLAQFKAATDKS